MNSLDKHLHKLEQSICSGNYRKVPTPREALPIGAEWHSAIQGPDKGDPAFLRVYSAM